MVGGKKDLEDIKLSLPFVFYEARSLQSGRCLCYCSAIIISPHISFLVFAVM